MRRHARYSVEAAVHVSCNDADGRQLAMTGSCLNISEGGLMMRLPEAIPILSQVSFRISDLDFEGTGTVRHCGSAADYSLVGVEFDDGQRYVVESLSQPQA